MPLYSSWLVPCGWAWSMEVWLSTCWLAVHQVEAVERASVPSERVTLTSLRDQGAAERDAGAEKLALRPRLANMTPTWKALGDSIWTL